MLRSARRWPIVALSCATLALTALALGQANDQPKPKGDDAGQPKETGVATAKTLGGEERYLTHLSTDKPVYRTGETVYVRGVILEAHDRQPLPENQPAQSNWEVRGPKGDVVASGNTPSQDSVLGFAWKVPDGQAGGEYKVKVSYPWQGHAPAERKFEVRAYRAPRLKSQIEFVRDGYGPGDTVAASLEVERAEGGIPVDARVIISARVDGAEVHQSQTIVDPSGIVSARFELPKEIARGEGTLSFTIDDGGAVETAAKTIPILLQTVDLNFYPEGGDLVAGLPSRVYVEAKTPAQKPADISGVIVDDQGKEIAELKTEHEGRGRTMFTPEKGRKYALKITKPSGIKKTFPLPEAKAEGVTLSADEQVTATGEPVSLRVASSDDQDLKVILRKREQVVATKKFKAKAGKPVQVELDPKDANGVLVATVEAEDGTPLAERLVFFQPEGGLNVTVKADKQRYTPGGTATLTIKATGADGKPVAAVVGLTVTDDSVREMIEKREQPPRLPVMVLLEPHVKELADAHVYLDPKDPEAPAAVDLLLGTQGWRRFAFYTTEEFVKQHGDEARRVLALTVPTVRPQLMFFKGAARGGALPLGVAREGAKVGLDRAEAVDEAAAPVPEDAAVPENAAAVPVEAPLPNAPAKPGQGQPPQAGAEELKQAPAQQFQAQNGQAQEVQGPPVDARRKNLADLATDAELRADRDRLIAGGQRHRIAGGFGQYVVVREYAHKARPDRQPGDRRDFTETLYWHAGVKTDPKTGEAKVSFDLSDSVTAFRVMADAFNGNGALAEAAETIESVEPFYVEPKLPLEVTSGDVIKLPLGLVNSTTDRLSQARLSVEIQGIDSAEFGPFTLAPEERTRHLLTLNIGPFSGTTDVVLSGTAGPYADRVTRPLIVKPVGFPVEIAHGGMLDEDGQRTHTVVIPETVVPGSLKAHAAVYPTPMANLTAALERLIREPYGCFEQTSSTTYPLVMAQQYFQSHSGIDPKLIERSNEMLAKGYDRLTGFECKDGGFEWFGEDPGHEALTAYGLMEFTDMAEVYNVDRAMLERTRKWLLDQRDGKGHFKRTRRALHTWVTDQEISDAYITWALLSADAGLKDELAKEIDTVARASEESKNTYVLALAANVLHLAGREDERNAILDRLIHLQQPDGSLSGASGSIVGSGGQALTIETTALATLAWLSHLDYIDFADKGVKFLAGSCEGGSYGNTQSTVLALKAIVAFDKSRAKPKAPGSVQLVVDGKPVGEPAAFTTDTQGAIELPEFNSLLTPGRHEVELQMTDGSRMPYTVTVDLHSEKPADSDECQLDLSVALNDKAVREGALTEARVIVKNTAKETVPTPIAIVGIPGGLEVRHDRLKELVKAGQIASYEVLGREVVLYWRELAAGAERDISLSLVAALPGEYTGPASRTYLYYTNEHKRWADSLKITIEPLADNAAE